MSHTGTASRRFLHAALIILLLSIALTLRLWHADVLPGGLYPDEAVNGIDALQAAETGDYRLFYENNYGREGLFINLEALAIKAFGVHAWVLRLWSAVFGTLAVFGLYLLALELWHKRWVALGSAALMTFSYWGINFSRIGFRAIMVPFLLVFAAYCFFLGLRTRRLTPLFFSGVFLGLGLHTYIAFRIVPLVFVVLALGFALSYREFFRRYWKHAVALLAGAAIAAAPMFYDFARHPEHFSSRTGAVSILSPEINHGHLLATFAKTFGLSLAKYNFWGDQNWRHNYPPYPILDPLTGVLFLTGFIFLFPRTIRLLARRLKDQDRNRELAICLFLLGGFFAMLVPEFLTEEGLPHALRSIGTQPFVFLIAALPLLWFAEARSRSGHGARLAMDALIVVLFVTVAAWNSVKYFTFFADNPAQYSAFNRNYTDMAEYLRSLPADLPKFVYANAGGTDIDNGLPVTAQPIAFLTHGRVDNLRYVLPGQDPSFPVPSVIILMSYDERFIDSVRTAHPDIGIENVDPHPGTQSSFTVIHVR